MEQRPELVVAAYQHTADEGGRLAGWLAAAGGGGGVWCGWPWPLMWLVGQGCRCRCCSSSWTRRQTRSSGPPGRRPIIHPCIIVGQPAQGSRQSRAGRPAGRHGAAGWQARIRVTAAAADLRTLGALVSVCLSCQGVPAAQRAGSERAGAGAAGAGLLPRGAAPTSAALLHGPHR